MGWFDDLIGKAKKSDAYKEGRKDARKKLPKHRALFKFCEVCGKNTQGEGWDKRICKKCKSNIGR